MIARIIKYFDKLEDRIRHGLSRQPILYAAIAALGVVLIWKGVWETAEYFPILHGPGSVLVGFLLLLATGLLVSVFVGDSILLSGLKREKKLVEKTETEVRAEEEGIERIESELADIRADLESLKEEKDTK
jgi:hypothetical protein